MEDGIRNQAVLQLLQEPLLGRILQVWCPQRLPFLCPLAAEGRLLSAHQTTKRLPRMASRLTSTPCAL